MKIETENSMSPNTARVMHIGVFVLACAFPTWVIFQIDGDSLTDYACRAIVLIVIGWLMKGLFDGLRRVEEVEISSIVQCLPWRLAAAKKRKR